MFYQTPSLGHLSKDDFEFIYEPAEDTFLFLDALEAEAEFLKNLRPLICLEVGAGSGCVISFMASILNSGTYYICTDINSKATTAARETGIANKCQINPIITNLVGGLLPRLENRVDIILFNPPYVVTDSSEVISEDMLTRSWAGGKSGREVTDQILPLISKLLSPNGVFYLIAIQENRPDEIGNIMSEFGFKMEIVLKRKAGIERLMVLKFSSLSV